MIIKYIFSFLIVPAMLLACAGAPKVSDEQLSSAYGDVSPIEAFKQAEKSFDRASYEKLKSFSPHQYAQAKKALDEARKIYQKSPTDRDLLKYTYVFDQHLKKAQQIRTFVEEKLAALFELKTSLVEIEVKRSFASKYNDILSDIKGLIQDVEEVQSSNKIDKSDVADNTQKRDDILADMMALEINVVKFNTLDKSEKKLAEAENNDAHKLAQKTFATANKELAKANSFITANVKDIAGIKAVGEAFTFAVDHVVQVASAVKELQNLKKKNYEDYILNNEKYLLKVSNALDHKDSRDKPVAEQVKLLVNKATSIVSANKQSLQSASDIGNSQLAMQEDLNTARQQAEKAKAEFEQRVVQLKTENRALEAQYATLKFSLENVMRIEKAKPAENINTAFVGPRLPEKTATAFMDPKLPEKTATAFTEQPTSTADAVKTTLTSSEQSIATQILTHPQPVDLKKALEVEATTDSVAVETAAIDTKPEAKKAQELVPTVEPVNP